MSEKRGFLGNAYTVGSRQETQALYKDWAKTYEQEIRDNGYATPRRCAEALAAQADDRDAPVLDLGCGTGLSGEALRDAGFTTIDGTDFSAEMLEVAAAKPGLYRSLLQGDLANPLPAAPGQYRHVAAVGVLSPSHAPAATIGQTVALLPSGGCFVFSLNDHTLADPSFQAEIERLVTNGQVEEIFRAYGDHLPGQDLKAEVVVLRRL